MKRTLVGALLLVSFLSPDGAAADARFPLPPSLVPAVDFWTRVYTEVGTDGGFIHDSREMGVVYEVVKIPKGTSRRSRERITDRAKKKYRDILRRLAQGKRSGLSSEESRVLALWPSGVSNSTLKGASSRLRFQLGQANKFRAGLIRSGAYKPHIERELKAAGVPAKLAALPHVESSYTPYAYSHVGAAGLWQFTRSTGRRFMRVDHVVDERLDPFRASRAAARLLDQNFKVTGSWPLAVTAYNHGASGMRRAKRKTGTDDIGVIVAKYKSRTFGFASRNFYTEFLAASRIDQDFERYFGPLPMDSPIDFAKAKTTAYVPARSLQKALAVDRSVLKKHNPALLAPVWEGSKRVPKNFTIAVPRDLLSRPLEGAIASVPKDQQYARQTRDRTHKVRRGETLSQIAARYGVSMRQLSELNGLRNRNRIRAGQKLRLPVDGSSPAPPPTAVAHAEAPADGIYTVRRGDTLSSISRRFGVPPAELARMNNLRNKNQLAVGQKLAVRTDAQAPVVVARVDAAPPPKAKAPAAAAREPAAAVPDEMEAEAAQPQAVASVAQTGAGDDPGPAAGLDPPDPEEPIQLKADPSDYSVDSKKRIEVQATETLGHYAEWLDLRASQLRRINGLRYGTPISVGERLELDFSRVSTDEFERQRLAYHRDLQETFFEQYEISGTTSYKTRRGDSLWSLSLRSFKIPVWLLLQYNPDVDFSALHPGTKLSVPEVQRHGLGTDSASRVPAPATRHAGNAASRAIR
jgi:membrane-bound lytic murein transglycosylase D